ncbi:hypothetical protein VOLCADRAFT_89268 [Volvox carteri f. nagariensis]|uniref:U-box domain-containing protein n=1 Tax=Volvox carteri f. nagariensis TaxID=3068 RepID=D8TR96_VOLCA|nr:uncharacterized protein VOLCADRAFT_89268 [Volvox carteri f. nagariensis]EFJ49852.1 hypothetical protein VOLCADRAFT_89268 [Volvox carteri f. nagariensis]|eukprot:XP_002948917.1 hypothetical protein VOLCADRAFT_89268 [Volvox carteri f. nagariensis]
MFLAFCDLLRQLGKYGALAIASQNMDEVYRSVMTAADYLSILNDSAQIGTYKELLSNLGKLSHEVRAHKCVLQTLAQSYQPSLEDTDFTTLLDQGLHDRLQQQPYNPRNDERFREFMGVVAAAGGCAGEPDGVRQDEGGDELDDDEDFREADNGRTWVNDKCPLSMKEVLDLERPMKDPLNYVYEYTYIMAYLQPHPTGFKHPCAGVRQELRVSDLKPATDVIRAKRRQRLMQALNPTGPSGSNNADGRETAEDVIVV